MTSSPSGRTPTWIVPAGVVIAATIAIALILGDPDGDDSAAAPTPAASASTTTSPETTASASPAPEADAPADAPDLSDAERRDPDDPLATGDVDAPVAIIVFSDYQCPYCARWAEETLPELDPYIEAGQVRVEHRDVNVFGEASVRGARAAYAAALQGEFHAMHEALFEDGMPRAATQLTDERLSDLARDIGLDGEQFDADYSSEATAEAVARNQELGIGLGAFSTPTFIIGGTPLVGAQPTDVFLGMVEEALAAAGDSDS